MFVLISVIELIFDCESDELMYLVVSFVVKLFIGLLLGLFVLVFDIFIMVVLVVCLFGFVIFVVYGVCVWYW